jgi:hypothetical protein
MSSRPVFLFPSLSPSARLALPSFPPLGPAQSQRLSGPLHPILPSRLAARGPHPSEAHHRLLPCDPRCFARAAAYDHNTDARRCSATPRQPAAQRSTHPPLTCTTASIPSFFPCAAVEDGQRHIRPTAPPGSLDVRWTDAFKAGRCPNTARHHALLLPVQRIGHLFFPLPPVSSQATPLATGARHGRLRSSLLCHLARLLIALLHHQPFLTATSFSLFSLGHPPRHEPPPFTIEPRRR